MLLVLVVWEPCAFCPYVSCVSWALSWYKHIGAPHPSIFFVSTTSDLWTAQCVVTFPKCYSFTLTAGSFLYWLEKRLSSKASTSKVLLKYNFPVVHIKAGQYQHVNECFLKLCPPSRSLCSYLEAEQIAGLLCLAFYFYPDDVMKLNLLNPCNPRCLFERFLLLKLLNPSIFQSHFPFFSTLPFWHWPFLRSVL